MLKGRTFVFVSCKKKCFNEGLDSEWVFNWSVVELFFSAHCVEIMMTFLQTGNTDDAFSVITVEVHVL